MAKARFYPWLRARFGIVLPNVSKDFIESFFKWLSYNAAIALVLKVAVALVTAHRWIVLVPVTVLDVVLLDLTIAYGTSQVALPLLDPDRPRKVVGLGLVMAAITVLQLTFWVVAGALASS